MKRLLMTYLALLILLAAAAPALAEDCPEVEPAKMMEAQQKMMALMGPGPEHEVLAKFEGEWNAAMKMWPMAGAEPMTATLSSTNESVLGGRFMKMVGKGMLMGMPLENVSYYGYDRRHEVYTLVGMDTMGTYYITAEGSYDAASKTLTLSGSDEDPVAGITQVYDMVFTFVDDNSFTMGLIFHCPTYGADGPHKLMELTFTRAEG